MTDTAQRVPDPSAPGRAVAPVVMPDPTELRALMRDMRRLALTYKFGIDEVMTKIAILRDEFRHMANYNPVEHVGSRLKSFESIVTKCRRKGIELTPEAVRAQMFDIAGVRVTCSFVSDIYRVRDMLVGQADLTLLEERDYIAHPKGNGYQSLHLIVQVPVYLSDRVEQVVVEIQLRTIAMDFWASLEHKIYYKYDRQVPRHLTDSLKLAADVAAQLDSGSDAPTLVLRGPLARELARKATGRTLYVLDEPTTGLHFTDIEVLLSALLELRDQGNTVVVIEHNLDVVACADWVIDLGPEGGDKGGTIVASGTPEAIAKTVGSHTGHYLTDVLARAAESRPKKKGASAEAS